MKKVARRMTAEVPSSRLGDQCYSPAQDQGCGGVLAGQYANRAAPELANFVVRIRAISKSTRAAG
jgi:hypothetical protein